MIILTMYIKLLPKLVKDKANFDHSDIFKNNKCYTLISIFLKKKSLYSTLELEQTTKSSSKVQLRKTHFYIFYIVGKIFADGHGAD